MKLFVTLAFLILFCGAAQAQESKLISFSDAESSETIRVMWQSHGCFHHSSDEMEIRSDLVSVEGAGVRAISRTDRRKLDTYFEYVRSVGGRNTCTTVNTFFLKKVVDGQVVQEEKLTDGSCFSMSRLRDPDFTERSEEFLTPQMIAFVVRESAKEAANP